LTIKKHFVERRKKNRFKVKEGALVQFYKPPRFKLGKPRVIKSAPIIDISVGGLRFEYIARNMWPHNFDSLVISKASDKTRIDNVPFKAVSDFPISTLPNSTTLRSCGVKFMGLSPNQKSYLDSFIRDYTISNQTGDRRASPDRRSEDAPQYNDTEKRSGKERRRNR